MLCAESRKEMEDWISALKSVQKWETYEVSVTYPAYSEQTEICQIHSHLIKASHGCVIDFDENGLHTLNSSICPPQRVHTLLLSLLFFSL